MSPGETLREIIGRQARAWQRAEVDAIVADFSTDGEFVVPGRRWHGQGEIRAGCEEFFAAARDITVDIHWTAIQDDRGAVEWTFAYTEWHSGRRIVATDAILIDLDRGRIRSWREYFDPSGSPTSLRPGTQETRS